MLDGSEDAQASDSLHETRPRLDSLNFAGDVADDRDTINDEKREKVAKKNAEQRYGKNLRVDKCKATTTTLNFVLICTIIMIPSQLFFQGFMKGVEDPLIIDLQAATTNTTWGNGGTMDNIITGIFFAFDPYFAGILQIIWFLLADSLLAFKGSMVSMAGIFSLTMLNLLYSDGRPYWNTTKIVPNVCVFSFSSPCQETFSALFFPVYKIIMSRYKYTSETNSYVNALLIFLTVILNITIYFAGFKNGTNYIYQSFMGSMYAFVYLVACITFDKEIHRFCEKAGFILQKSRYRKFKTLFIVVIAWTVVFMFICAKNSTFDIPQTWILNVSENEICNEKLNSQAYNRLGTNQTFDQTAILFFIVGMVFGQSYSLNYIKPLLWVHSEWWRRLIRCIIGTGLSIGFSLGMFKLA